MSGIACMVDIGREMGEGKGWAFVLFGKKKVIEPLPLIRGLPIKSGFVTGPSNVLCVKQDLSTERSRPTIE